MKQTVTILTALMTALLLVSGFIVMGSVQQSDLLMKREEQLLAKAEEAEEWKTRAAQLESEHAQAQEQLQKLHEERDALSQQLTDTLLASQESNDAVAQQEAAAQALGQENEQLRSQIKKLERENAAAIHAYEEQIARLEMKLQEATIPAAAPLRVERRVQQKP